MLCGLLCATARADDVPALDLDVLAPHCVCLDTHGRIAPLHCRPAVVADEVARVERLLDPDPRVGDFARWSEAENSGELLLWAHGALVDENLALQQLAALMNCAQAPGGKPVYVIGFVWPTLPAELDQFELSVRYVTQPIAAYDDPLSAGASRLYMQHQIEQPARDVVAMQLMREVVGLRARWDDIKRLASDAVHYTSPGAPAGGELVLRKLAALVEARRHSAYPVRVHFGGHSAGAVLAGHLARVWAGSPANTYAGVPKAARDRTPGAPRALRGMGRPIASCTLLAPACTADFFQQVYAPLLDSGTLARLLVYTLPDSLERTETYVLGGETYYTGSPLYLLAEDLEAPTLDALPTPGDLPGPGGGRLSAFPELRPVDVAILGREIDLRRDPRLARRFTANTLRGGCGWVISGRPRAEAVVRPYTTAELQGGGLDVKLPAASRYHPVFATDEVALASMRRWMTADAPP